MLADDGNGRHSVRTHSFPGNNENNKTIKYLPPFWKQHHRARIHITPSYGNSPYPRSHLSVTCQALHEISHTSLLRKLSSSSKPDFWHAACTRNKKLDIWLFHHPGAMATMFLLIPQMWKCPMQKFNVATRKKTFDRHYFSEQTELR